MFQSLWPTDLFCSTPGISELRENVPDGKHPHHGQPEFTSPTLLDDDDDDEDEKEEEEEEDGG